MLRWVALFSSAAVVAVVRRMDLSPVRVEGASMTPTLPPGALVAVSPLRGDPSLGAVVVVRRPDGSEHLKRVAGLPGDSFRLAGGDAITLTEGSFALAGDNRDASTDSRHHGPVAREHIVAIARLCYWPPRAWRIIPR